MSESPEPDLDELPQAVVAERRWFNPSLVWLIPLLAALIGGWLAVNAVLTRGPTITILFTSGEGLEAGKTRIKYKDVDIGEVSAVTLSPDRHHIVVSARLVRDAAPYLVEDSRFWVVHPRITGSSISGLSTLLTGAYIGMDVGKSARARESYVGLEEAPLVTGDLPGRQYALLADDLGSLAIGSPVFYRRVPVGQVVAYHLTPDGRNVAVSVFIHHPYDSFVTTDSRFWHASGIDVSLDANGLKIDTQSLASVALGGVAFDNPDPDLQKEPLAPDHRFVLARDQDQAMRRLEVNMKTWLVRFQESVRGLSVGAPVDFRGITIGEVASIGLDADVVTHDLGMAVRIHVYPDRLLALAGEPQTRYSIEQLSLRRVVARGMRAQLKSANLLTGQLYVALDYFPDAPRAGVRMQGGLPVVPSVPGDMNKLQHTLVDIARHIDQIPMAALSADLRHTLHNLDVTLQSTNQMVGNVNGQMVPQTLQALQSLQQTLNVARQTLQPDSALQQDLRDAAQQVSAAAKRVGTLSDTLERHPEALIRGKPEDAQ